MKVVAIGGSPRLNGYTNYMLDQACNELTSRGVECEKIVLNQYKITPCQGCPDCATLEKCIVEDDAPWIVEKYRAADGLLIASPTYFATITAQMKTFMDRTIWLNRHQVKAEAKVAGLIAICGRGGDAECLEELKKFFRFLPDTTVLSVHSPGGDPQRDPKDLVEVVEQCKNMGRQMAEILTAGSN